MKEKSLYQMVENDLASKILNGTLEAGSQLMPENQLTEHYGVSRITIRNAMVNLVERGLVERVRGRGSFVASDVDTVLPGISHPTGIKSSEIAIILPRVRDLHTTQILDSVYRHARAHGYTVSINQTYHDQKAEELCIRESVEREVAGMIIYPVQRDKYNEEIIKLVLRRFPIVLVDRNLEGINVNSVVTDNEKAAFDATTFLMEQGHQRIGLVTSPLEYAAPLKSRYDGYVRAHYARGLIADERLVHYYKAGDIDENFDMDPRLMTAQVDSAASFLESHRDMTAVVCTEPIDGVVVMLAARKLGRRIPEELSAVFFDEFEMADLLYVPPTVVKQNSAEMGRVALERLHALIEGDEDEGALIKVNADLVLRQSTGAAPAAPNDR